MARGYCVPYVRIHVAFQLTGSQKKTCVELKKQMKQWKQAVKRRDADAHERVLKEVDRLHKQLRQ